MVEKGNADSRLIQRARSETLTGEDANQQREQCDEQSAERERCTPANFL
jgi:hypothetical protein